MVAALMLAVPACSTADPVIRTVMLTRPVPEAARVPCRAPVLVPERNLAAREVTSLWARDRASLRECEARRRVAVGLQEERPSQERAVGGDDATH